MPRRTRSDRFAHCLEYTIRAPDHEEPEVEGAGEGAEQGRKTPRPRRSVAAVEEVLLGDLQLVFGASSRAARRTALSMALRMSPPAISKSSARRRRSTLGARGARGGRWARQIRSRSSASGIRNITWLWMRRSKAGSKFAARLVAKITTPSYCSSSWRRMLTDWL